MPQGKLEVLLVGAKGLRNTEFFGKMDPYAILTCRTQQRKSSVAREVGSRPEWNEYFIFTITDVASELDIKIMDKDTFTADDFVGRATIPLRSVFAEGSIPPTAYNLVNDGEYCGEIKIGLNFTPKASHDQGFDTLEESYGGWKESAEGGSCGGWKESAQEESYGGWKESAHMY
ncbi:elicitor-responsive protein 3-like [Malania oleifera]|uniref:elicitor-responsive protein 3-like n=1 Tax=Malania oleifera TaxID=397392 RepID=UPI0025AD9DE4|nr:elicitor-responsive protein 3-like [Malania oleifera]